MLIQFFRDEPEVLALAVLVLAVVFAKPPEIPRFRVDLDTGLPGMEYKLPRVQFIRFR